MKKIKQIQSTQKVIKKITPKDVAGFAKCLSSDTHPNTIFEKISKKLKDLNGKSYMKDLNDEEKLQLTFAGGLSDTHLPLAIAMLEKYAPLAISYTDQLIKEYECAEPSEKSLAQIAASAYVRSIAVMHRMHSIQKEDGVNKLEIKWLTFLSKELDRAERQYMTALSALKQLHTPSFSVNVKTTNAFLAENQQFNNSKKENNES